MKLLTCAGYYATGSSAITDLIAGCQDIHSCGDFEFRFVQDPDGICDLEYNLVLNNHRHNSGYAIKRYLKTVDFWNGNILMKRYQNYFGEAWVDYSKKYIDALIDAEYKGWWYRDIVDKGRNAYFFERLFDVIVNEHLFKNSKKHHSLLMSHYTNIVSYPGESFYSITKKYIDDLFSIVNKDNKEFVFADQLVPASNTAYYLKFFNNLKVICVDRDPRDVFLIERHNEHGTVVPQNVNDFCKWYKATRAHKKYESDNPNVLRINFEDLVYHYKETRDIILKFYGIDRALFDENNSNFDPSKSVNNTRLWEKYNIEQERRIIERELVDYLYSNY